MADLSKIKIPNGTTYNLKDASAIKAITSDGFDITVQKRNDTSEVVHINHSVANRNALYRGNSLGSSLTDAQYNAITGGTFYDMYVGDYWEINNIKYRIAGFNLLYQFGDSSANRTMKPHLVLIPDSNLTTAAMNTTDVATGAYLNSDFKQNNATVLPILEAAFGSSRILQYRNYYTSAVSSAGVPNSSAFAFSKFDLMSEIQVFGAPYWSNNGSVRFNMMAPYGQFPLFQLAPWHIATAGNSNSWLCDIRSATRFCMIRSLYPLPGSENASVEVGIRPFFLIG